MTLSSRQRWITVSLMTLTLAVYWLTFLGKLRSIDEIAILSVAENLVKHGTLSANQVAFTYTAGQESLVGIGASGDVYPHKGLLPSLLAAPFYALAQRWPGVGLVQAALLLNPLLTALTAGLIYLLAIRWGFTDQAGIAAALSYSCGTLAWHYGQTLFTEPSAALAWIATLYCLVQSANSPRGAGWTMLAGGLTGLAAGASYAYIVAVPMFGAYLALQIKRMDERPWMRLAAFGAGCLATLALWSLANQLRFGYWLGTGYSLQSETLRLTGTGTRLYGLLLSPYRGLIWYVPLTPAALIGFVALYRPRALEGLLCAGLTLAVIEIYSLWTVWWGAVNWGPRYLVPLMPFLCLGLIPIWEWMFHRTAPWIARGAFGVLLAWSAAVQIVSVLTDYVPYDFENWLRYSRLLVSDTPIRAVPILYDPRLSPLWLQAQALRQGQVELAWLHDGLALAACVLGVIVAMASLVLVTRSHRPRVIALASGGVLALVVLWTLPRATASLTHPATRDLATFIQTNARPDDAIVHIMPDAYTEFAALNRSPGPVYGLPREAPLRPELMRVLERIARDHRAVWVVSTGSPTADPQNDVEAWLVQNSFKAYHAYYGKVRLSVFATHIGEQANIGHSERLGTAIRLWIVDLPRQVFHAGDIIPLTLTWQALAPVQQNIAVFVHLYDATGAIVAQRDAPPLDGYRPVATWPVGGLVVDRHGVMLPRQLAPGDYVLAVGMYDTTSGQRLVVDPPQPGDRIVLATVQVWP